MSSILEAGLVTMIVKAVRSNVVVVIGGIAALMGKCVKSAEIVAVDVRGNN